MLFIALIGSRRAAGDISCRNCGTKVASEKDLFSAMGRPARATYVNPLGLACEIITVRRAAGLVAGAFSSEEHTWFEGFAWRPVACASCQAHLGWRYEASAPGLEPRVFYGLLIPALALPGEPGRDA